MTPGDEERLTRGLEEWAERWRLTHPQGRGIVLQIADGTSLSPVELADQVRRRTPVGLRFINMVDRVTNVHIRVGTDLPPRQRRVSSRFPDPFGDPISLNEILDGLAREGHTDRRRA